MSSKGAEKLHPHTLEAKELKNHVESVKSADDHKVLEECGTVQKKKRKRKKNKKAPGEKQEVSDKESDLQDEEKGERPLEVIETALPKKEPNKIKNESSKIKNKSINAAEVVEKPKILENIAKASQEPKGTVEESKPPRSKKKKQKRNGSQTEGKEKLVPNKELEEEVSDLQEVSNKEKLDLVVNEDLKYPDIQKKGATLEQIAKETFDKEHLTKVEPKVDLHQESPRTLKNRKRAKKLHQEETLTSFENQPDQNKNELTAMPDTFLETSCFQADAIKEVDVGSEEVGSEVEEQKSEKDARPVKPKEKKPMRIPSKEPKKLREESLECEYNQYDVTSNKIEELLINLSLSSASNSNRFTKAPELPESNNVTASESVQKMSRNKPDIFKDPDKEILTKTISTIDPDKEAIDAPEEATASLIPDKIKKVAVNDEGSFIEMENISQLSHLEETCINKNWPNLREYEVQWHKDQTKRNKWELNALPVKALDPNIFQAEKVELNSTEVNPQKIDLNEDASGEGNTEHVLSNDNITSVINVEKGGKYVTYQCEHHQHDVHKIPEKVKQLPMQINLSSASRMNRCSKDLEEPEADIFSVLKSEEQNIFEASNNEVDKNTTFTVDRDTEALNGLEPTLSEPENVAADMDAHENLAADYKESFIAIEKKSQLTDLGEASVNYKLQNLTEAEKNNEIQAEEAFQPQKKSYAEAIEISNSLDIEKLRPLQIDQDILKNIEGEKVVQKPRRPRKSRNPRKHSSEETTMDKKVVENMQNHIMFQNSQRNLDEYPKIGEQVIDEEGIKEPPNSPKKRRKVNKSEETPSKDSGFEEFRMDQKNVEKNGNETSEYEYYQQHLNKLPDKEKQLPIQLNSSSASKINSSKAREEFEANILNAVDSKDPEHYKSSDNEFDTNKNPTVESDDGALNGLGEPLLSEPDKDAKKKHAANDPFIVVENISHLTDLEETCINYNLPNLIEAEMQWHENQTAYENPALNQYINKTDNSTLKGAEIEWQGFRDRELKPIVETCLQTDILEEFESSQLNMSWFAENLPRRDDDFLDLNAIKEKSNEDQGTEKKASEEDTEKYKLIAQENFNIVPISEARDKENIKSDSALNKAAYRINKRKIANTANKEEILENSKIGASLEEHMDNSMEEHQPITITSSTVFKTGLIIESTCKYSTLEIKQDQNCLEVTLEDTRNVELNEMAEKPQKKSYAEAIENPKALDLEKLRPLQNDQDIIKNTLNIGDKKDEQKPRRPRKSKHPRKRSSEETSTIEQTVVKNVENPVCFQNAQQIINGYPNIEEQVCDKEGLKKLLESPEKSRKSNKGQEKLPEGTGLKDVRMAQKGVEENVDNSTRLTCEITVANKLTDVEEYPVVEEQLSCQQALQELMISKDDLVTMKKPLNIEVNLSEIGGNQQVPKSPKKSRKSSKSPRGKTYDLEKLSKDESVTVKKLLNVEEKLSKSEDNQQLCASPKKFKRSNKSPKEKALDMEKLVILEDDRVTMEKLPNVNETLRKIEEEQQLAKSPKKSRKSSKSPRDKSCDMEKLIIPKDDPVTVEKLPNVDEALRKIEEEQQLPKRLKKSRKSSKSPRDITSDMEKLIILKDDPATVDNLPNIDEKLKGTEEEQQSRSPIKSRKSSKDNAFDMDKLVIPGDDPVTMEKLPNLNEKLRRSEEVQQPCTSPKKCRRSSKSPKDKTFDMEKLVIPEDDPVTMEKLLNVDEKLSKSEEVQQPCTSPKKCRRSSKSPRDKAFDMEKLVIAEDDPVTVEKLFNVDEKLSNLEEVQQPCTSPKKSRRSSKSPKDKTFHMKKLVIPEDDPVTVEKILIIDEELSKSEEVQQPCTSPKRSRRSSKSPRDKTFDIEKLIIPKNHPVTVEKLPNVDETLRKIEEEQQLAKSPKNSSKSSKSPRDKTFDMEELVIPEDDPVTMKKLPNVGDTLIKLEEEQQLAKSPKKSSKSSKSPRDNTSDMEKFIISKDDPVTVAKCPNVDETLRKIEEQQLAKSPKNSSKSSKSPKDKTFNMEKLVIPEDDPVTIENLPNVDETLRKIEEEQQRAKSPKKSRKSSKSPRGKTSDMEKLIISKEDPVTVAKCPNVDETLRKIEEQQLAKSPNKSRKSSKSPKDNTSDIEKLIITKDDPVTMEKLPNVVETLGKIEKEQQLPKRLKKSRKSSKSPRDITSDMEKLIISKDDLATVDNLPNIDEKLRGIEEEQQSCTSPIKSRKSSKDKTSDMEKLIIPEDDLVTMKKPSIVDETLRKIEEEQQLPKSPKKSKKSSKSPRDITSDNNMEKLIIPQDDPGIVEKLPNVDDTLRKIKEEQQLPKRPKNSRKSSKSPRDKTSDIEKLIIPKDDPATVYNLPNIDEKLKGTEEDQQSRTSPIRSRKSSKDKMSDMEKLIIQEDDSVTLEELSNVDKTLRKMEEEQQLPKSSKKSRKSSKSPRDITSDMEELIIPKDDPGIVEKLSNIDDTLRKIEEEQQLPKSRKNSRKSSKSPRNKTSDMEKLIIPKDDPASPKKSRKSSKSPRDITSDNNMEKLTSPKDDPGIVEKLPNVDDTLRKIEEQQLHKSPKNSRKSSKSPRDKTSDIEKLTIPKDDTVTAEKLLNVRNKFSRIESEQQSTRPCKKSKESSKFLKENTSVENAMISEDDLVTIKKRVSFEEKLNEIEAEQQLSRISTKSIKHPTDKSFNIKNPMTLNDNSVTVDPPLIFQLPRSTRKPRKNKYPKKRILEKSNLELKVVEPSGDSFSESTYVNQVTIKLTDLENTLALQDSQVKVETSLNSEEQFGKKESSGTSKRSKSSHNSPRENILKEEGLLSPILSDGAAILVEYQNHEEQIFDKYSEQKSSRSHSCDKKAKQESPRPPSKSKNSIDTPRDNTSEYSTIIQDGESNLLKSGNTEDPENIFSRNPINSKKEDLEISLDKEVKQDAPKSPLKSKKIPRETLDQLILDSFPKMTLADSIMKSGKKSPLHKIDDSLNSSPTTSKSYLEQRLNQFEIEHKRFTESFPKIAFINRVAQSRESSPPFEERPLEITDRRVLAIEPIELGTEKMKIVLRNPRKSLKTTKENCREDPKEKENEYKILRDGNLHSSFSKPNVGKEALEEELPKKMQDLELKRVTKSKTSRKRSRKRSTSRQKRRKRLNSQASRESPKHLTVNESKIEPKGSKIFQIVMKKISGIFSKKSKSPEKKEKNLIKNMALENWWVTKSIYDEAEELWTIKKNQNQSKNRLEISPEVDPVFLQGESILQFPDPENYPTMGHEKEKVKFYCVICLSFQMVYVLSTNVIFLMFILLFLLFFLI